MKTIATTFGAACVAASIAFTAQAGTIAPPTNELCIDEPEIMETGAQDVRDLILFAETLMNAFGDNETYETIDYDEFEMQGDNGNLSHTFFNIDAGDEGRIYIMADENAKTACEVEEMTYRTYENPTVFQP